MRRKLQEKRWLLVSLSAVFLAGAALAGTAHAAGASPLTTHQGVLPPDNPARSMAPGTPLLSSCGAGNNGSTCNQMALTAIGLARQALEQMAACRSRSRPTSGSRPPSSCSWR